MEGISQALFFTYFYRSEITCNKKCNETALTSELKSDRNRKGACFHLRFASFEKLNSAAKDDDAK